MVYKRIKINIKLIIHVQSKLHAILFTVTLWYEFDVVVIVKFYAPCMLTKTNKQQYLRKYRLQNKCVYAYSISNFNKGNRNLFT